MTRYYAASTGDSTAIGDAAGISIVVLILVLACVTTVLATRSVFRGALVKGRSEGTASLLALVTMTAVFLGGWIFVDIGWLLGKAGRAVQRE